MLNQLSNKTILITGSAGFIGANLVMELLRTVSPVTIVGIDSVNDYYDVSIKEYRMEQIDKEAGQHPKSRYVFVKGNIADRELIDAAFARFDRIYYMDESNPYGDGFACKRIADILEYGYVTF